MSMDLNRTNEYMDSFAQVIGSISAHFHEYKGSLKTGIDLGTANICIAVLDETDTPVTGEIYPASVVKDGLVVDYTGSVAIVRQLKDKIERRLGVPLLYGAAAIPPGTVGKNAQIVSNVVQSADIEVINVVDEPSAAATAMKVSDGAVVDIGGGTTGISVLKDGKVIAVYDEPTGGTHMSLVLAGHYHITFEEAELFKLNPENQQVVFPIIRPVIEKMAVIVKNFVRNYAVDTIYVVGGASSFDGFENIIEKECGIHTIKPKHGLLITPLGIAIHCTKAGVL